MERVKQNKNGGHWDNRIPPPPGGATFYLSMLLYIFVIFPLEYLEVEHDFPFHGYFIGIETYHAHFNFRMHHIL